MNEYNNSNDLDGIAIIGMAGRFPGAGNITEFWQNLRNSVESVTFFSDEELAAAGIDADLYSSPDYVNAKAMLDDAEYFDAGFFGYTPREASAIDPQHRIFLESAWDALEDAGYNPQAQENSIGVFAGASINTYLLRNMQTDLFKSLDGLELGMSSDKDFLATRVSYKFNLKGPSIVVQTACSTSLVAVCQACQSLMSYQCDMALAGGVSIKNPRVNGYTYKQGAIASPDGHCRAFDADSRGTITGEGVGVVVLKRLQEALADGDTVHAVIKGFALNNDGSFKVGYTAPSVEGQADVIAMAQALAGIKADSISYIEAHGTGTDLGDPIEIAALSKAFKATTDRTGFCPIGSVKSNIGHLDAAAGVTGLIKTAMALEHREIPASLHYNSPNPEIDFANSPFYVNAELAPWPQGQTPRRAGVSSFGIGGTNAHVVLEEAPAQAPSGESRAEQLLLVSARTETALQTSLERLTSYLQEEPEAAFADVAYTLQVGRQAFDWRAVLVCRDAGEALEVLRAPASARLQRGRITTDQRPVVFMFTGQGSQYPHMGAGLYNSEAVYREVVERCCNHLRQHLQIDLMEMLYPQPGDDNAAAERLRDTRFAQPALFVTEYALAQLWMSWGVEPEAMIGHSIGEYVAACLAGVLTLEDALLLVAERGRLISELESGAGAMLAATLSEAEIEPLLGESLSLAAVNAPQLCVVSGPAAAIDELEGELRGRGLEPVRLHTSHAFHSSMMEPVLDEFAGLVSQLTLNAPQRPYLSNVSGAWISAEEAVDPHYWVKHLRYGVHFSAGIEQLLEDETRVFLEVGPGQTLSGLVRQHLPVGASGERVFNSLRGPREELADETRLLEMLGGMWLAGVTVDWKGFSGTEERRRTPLPTYPFERQKYWVEPGREAGKEQAAAEPVIASSDKASDISEWLYVPSWKQTPSPADYMGRTTEASRWLLFADEEGLADKLSLQLSSRGEVVFIVRQGESFEQEGDFIFSIDPGNEQHYEALFNALESQCGIPARIVHMWAVTGSSATVSSESGADAMLERCFWSPICISRAIGRLAASESFEMILLSSNMQDVTGYEEISAQKAALLGPCRVIPQEYPNIACRSVDLLLPEEGGRNEQLLLVQLEAELRTTDNDDVVVYRGVKRWVREYQQAPLDSPQGTPSKLRHAGVYLITGGLGGIGLAIAEYLAQSVSARLLLVGRSRLPDPGEWNAWLASHQEDDSSSRKIRRVRKLEGLGASVRAISADVTDRGQMQRVIEQAKAEFGDIHGVIHAAGIPAGGIIELKSRDSANAVLAPKVQGTLILDELFRGEQLDFMVLCSSLTAVLGSPGQVDYTAANAFLDTFAQARGRREQGLTASIEWDAWSESGMAVETDVPTDLAEWRRRDLEAGIRNEEGVEVFRRVIDCSLARVIVSTRDLFQRIKPAAAAAAVPSDAATPTPAAAPESGHARPSLSTDYVAPRNDTERAVAVVWQELFGIDQIGIDDNFLEIGGHSLLAIQVVSRLGKDLDVKLPVNVMFESPTILGIAEEVEKMRSKEDEEEQKLAEMLDMVDQLSDEEIKRLLAEKE